MPPRPHPLSRSRLVDRLNEWLAAAWGRGVLPRPTLDPQELWASAILAAPAEGETAGRCADDIADFRLRLERLCHALVSEAQLNPLGLAIAHGQLVRVIRQRLRLGAFWRDNPGVLAQEVAPPIIVVGQMRSGTTRMHRLLAADPQLAATRFCDSWHPVPASPDLRPFWSALSLFAGRRLNPWLDAIHPFGVTRPDEELGWLAAALDHCAYEAQWRIPSFTAFSEAREPASVYREFARILQCDAATRGNSHLPRVLKVPQFAEDLPALLARFPDARVVLTRRCANDVARSAASLVANQMTIQTDEADITWIEDECRRKVALRQARMDEALAGFGGPLAEVDFAALGQDWQAQIAKAYRALKLDLTEEALAAMAREQGRAALSPHRDHQASYQAFARA